MNSSINVASKYLIRIRATVAFTPKQKQTMAAVVFQAALSAFEI